MLKFCWRLFGSSRGNVALAFGLAALPVSMMVGMGIDLTNATRTRMALQDATDSAAISLARQAPMIADSAIASTAQSYIRASYANTSTVTVTRATIDRNTVTATISARADVPAYFSQIIGQSSIPVTSHAVAKGLLLEIALVLDNSGSMSERAGSSSKISALKTAADAFLDQMFGTATTSSRLKISIVPFAASVNVGTGNRTASWMDQSGASSLSEEDFSSSSKTRWQLFDDIGAVSWGGCVISRPAPYDVSDAAPTTGNGETLFVPWFAPDEPDGDNGNQNTGSFSNNYLNDEGGACSGSNASTNASDATKQARTCKYYRVAPSSAAKGPNFH